MTWNTGGNGHLGESPTQHRLRTAQCPSLPRLLSAAVWDLSPAERAHTVACSYCQKVIAMAWRYECPGMGVVVADLAGLSVIGLAMREHLEEDLCPRCLRLRRSPLLRSAATVLRDGRRSLQSIDAWLESAVLLTAPLPTTPGDLRVRAGSPGGLATVVHADLGLVTVEVESADPCHEGRRVSVELLGDGEPVEADLVLGVEGERCTARQALGPISELAPRLGASCEIVAVFGDDDSTRVVAAPSARAFEARKARRSRSARAGRRERRTGPPKRPRRSRRTGRRLAPTRVSGVVMTVAMAAILVALASSGPTWFLGRAEAAVPVIRLPQDCGRDGKAALEASGREALEGQRLVVAGVWEAGSTEADNFIKVLERFKEKTGAAVIYAYHQTPRDVYPELRRRIDGGCPPDVALLPQLGLFRDLARRRELRPVEGVAADLVKENYTSAARQVGVVDDVLYGVWFKAANKSMIWYPPGAFQRAGIEAPPRTWAELKAVADRIGGHGLAPFSIAGADGWTLTDWFENVYLSTAGPEMYDRLAAHTIPWTHPTVKRALATLAEIFNRPEWIAGGTEGALVTNYRTSVGAVFGPSPTAAMVYEGDFVAGTARDFTKRTGGGDAPRSFDFPTVGGWTPLVGGGDIAVWLTNNEAGRKLMEFLATPEAATIWAREGGFLSPNRHLDPNAYPDDATRSAARALTHNETLRFDLSDLQPPMFGGSEGMWPLFQAFLKRPGDVDGMARGLEERARLAWAPLTTSNPARN